MDPDLEKDRVLGAVKIGRGTYFDDSVQFLVFHDQERIEVGRYCSIAKDATIAAGGDHRADYPSTWPFDNFLRGLPNPTRTYRLTSSPTIIGSDVWIGAGCHVAAGVKVGHGAVLGTRSVVFSEVPPYAIVIGNPARVVRYRFSRSCIASLLRIEWWSWPPETIRARLDWFYQPVEKFIREFGRAEDGEG